MMVFVSLSFLFRYACSSLLAMLALGFCWMAEFSQLYHAAWRPTFLRQSFSTGAGRVKGSDE